MIRYIYRQRRRILFGTLFLSLALLVAMSYEFSCFTQDPVALPYWLIPTFLLICACIIALTITIYITVFPSWRHIVEILSIFALIDAILLKFFPAFIWDYWFSIFIPFALIMLIHSLAYGTLLDRFPLWVALKTTRSFKSPKSTEEIWSALLPGKAPIVMHWNSLLHEIQAIPDDPDSFELQYTHGHGLYQHMTITYLEDVPFSHAKYYFSGDVSPANSELVDGTYEIKIEPLKKGGNRIFITEFRNALLPRVGLQLWFDDYLGDSADSQFANDNNKRDWSLGGKYRRSVRKFS